MGPIFSICRSTVGAFIMADKLKFQKANRCLSAMLWVMFYSLFTSTAFLLVTFMFGTTTNPSKVRQSITSNPWFCDNPNLSKDSNNQVREICFAVLQHLHFLSISSRSTNSASDCFYLYVILNLTRNLILKPSKSNKTHLQSKVFYY